MVKVALLSLLAISALGVSTWTGKLEGTYILDKYEMRPESVYYEGGDIYLSHLNGQTIYKIDTDDLSLGEKTSKIEESEPHDMGSGYYPIGCCPGSSDRLYCTIGTLTGATNNGIGYWDMDSLKFGKSIQQSTSALAADCIVAGDYVYWTSSFSGEVRSCDKDLTTCSMVTDNTLVKKISFIGCMGVVHIEEDGEEFLVVTNPDRGELVKVPVKDGQLNGTVANVAITDTNNVLNGSDGLAKISDDVLVTANRNYVVLVETDDNWKTAVVGKAVYIHDTETGSDPWGAAHVGVRSDDKDEIKLYITFPGFESFFGGTTQQEFLLGYLKFSDEDVDDLDFSLALVSAILLWFA